MRGRLARASSRIRPTCTSCGPACPSGEAAGGRALADRLAVYGVPVEVVEAPTMAALLAALAEDDGALSGSA